MKASIYYNIDLYALENNLSERAYEAYLEFIRPSNGEREVIIARDKSFEAARARVIAVFKQLPPSEEIEL